MKWHSTKNSTGSWVFTDNCCCSLWRLECGGQQHSEPFAPDTMVFREPHIQPSLSTLQVLGETGMNAKKEEKFVVPSKHILNRSLIKNILVIPKYFCSKMLISSIFHSCTICFPFSHTVLYTLSIEEILNPSLQS